MLFILVQEEIIPTIIYYVSLDSLDGLKDYMGLIVPVVATGSELSSTVLEIAPLPFRRLWNVTVFAHDCDYHSLTQGIELGR